MVLLYSDQQDYNYLMCTILIFFTRNSDKMSPGKSLHLLPLIMIMKEDNTVTWTVRRPEILCTRSVYNEEFFHRPPGT